MLLRCGREKEFLPSGARGVLSPVCQCRCALRLAVRAAAAPQRPVPALPPPPACRDPTSLSTVPLDTPKTPAAFRFLSLRLEGLGRLLPASSEIQT